jgi:hypothetical protein
VSFASGDQIAIAAIPVGSIPDGAICSVKNIDPPSVSSGKTIVAGSYLLTCMSSMGQVLPLNGITVAWQLHLKDVIKDLGRPKAEYTNGTTTKSLMSSYDKKTYVLGFNTAATNSVLAVSSPKSNLWVSLLIIGLVILAIVAFLLFFPVRGHRRRSYQEYLRSKYYNL